MESAGYWNYSTASCTDDTQLRSYLIVILAIRWKAAFLIVNSARTRCEHRLKWVKIINYLKSAQPLHQIENR